MVPPPELTTLAPPKAEEVVPDRFPLIRRRKLFSFIFTFIFPWRKFSVAEERPPGEGGQSVLIVAHGVGEGGHSKGVDDDLLYSCCVAGVPAKGDSCCIFMLIKREEGVRDLFFCGCGCCCWDGE